MESIPVVCGSNGDVAPVSYCRLNNPQLHLLFSGGGCRNWFEEMVCSDAYATCQNLGYCDRIRSPSSVLHIWQLEALEAPLVSWQVQKLWNKPSCPYLHTLDQFLVGSAMVERSRVRFFFLYFKLDRTYCLKLSDNADAAQ